MKLFLILSRSLRQRVTKEHVPGLTPAHEQYHRPMRESDAILLQAMIRPECRRAQRVTVHDPAGRDAGGD